MGRDRRPIGVDVRFSAWTSVKRLRRARRHAERQRETRALREGTEPAPLKRKVWRVR